jgi:type II secretory pathway pseudopilin PulG
VHDFAALTTAEIERLIAHSNGRLCGRVTHTPEGRLVTADLVAIDSGWKGIASRTPALAGAALTAVLSVASGAAAQSATPSDNAAAKQKSSASCPTQRAEQQNVRSSTQPASQPSDAEPDATQPPDPIHGRVISVIDPSGAPLPDATLTLTKRGDGRKFVIKSDEQGRASLHGIPHGDYDIVGTAVGFQATTLTGVSLPANTKMMIDVGLVGEVVVIDPSRNPFRHFYNRLKTYL